jgi:hypothetical protein
VVDTIDTAGAVPVRLFWHLGPEVRAELDGAVARLSWPAPGGVRRATLVLPGALSWTGHRGQEQPALGWYSPGFGRRLPATSLVGTGPASADTRLVTLLMFA